MANLLKLMFGTIIAAVMVPPATAQYAGDPPISVHQRQHLRSSSPPSEPSPLRDPRTWVGDPAGRPYVYVPGQASGGQ